MSAYGDDKKPNWVFVDKLQLGNATALDAVFAAGGFHDAIIEDAKYADGVLRLCFSDIYFPRYREYGCFNLVGADLEIFLIRSFAVELQDGVEALIEVQSQVENWIDSEIGYFDVFEAIATGKLKCFFWKNESRSVTHNFELIFDVDPKKSTFQWRFRQ